ncbi:interleukin-17D-like [Pelobates cultripes]|uniref:Interleukin-17D-like n=2 Tax=Pelobates cultripes TaxID=61616 RepID=A0AAD1W7U2_PELCU|nr:interleukin-17D-like [Pelobates cultripes]
MKMKFLLLIIVMIPWTQSHGTHTRCKQPSHEHLKQRLIRLAPDALLYLNKQDITPDLELKNCPKSVNQTSDLIQDRSISPWSYRINEDLNRYPHKILEAYCLCKGCISSFNKPATSMVSEPFYKEIPVLIKTSKCKKEKVIFKLRYIKIAQFCICRFH